jgi:thioredoxin-dependent peroxiredoxin
MTQLSLNTIAPDFTLNNQKGEKINLYDILESGQKVLLVFYPGDMTPGCTSQLCGIRDIYKEYKDLNVTIFGMNHSNEKSHQKFIDMHNYQFDILVDTNKEVSRQYGQISKLFTSEIVKRGVILINTDKKIVYIKQGQQNNAEVINFIKTLN